MVLNVLDNAIVHSKCSEITITSEVNEEYYYLVIQDNGIGIDEKKRKKGCSIHFFTPKKQKKFWLRVIYLKRDNEKASRRYQYNFTNQ